MIIIAHKDKCNTVKRFLILMTVILISTYFTTACQPTPEHDAVTGKDDLKDEINTTAAPNDAVDSESDTEVVWQYEKQYDSGNKLYIDSVVCNADATNLPVISIEPKLFESGDSLRSITEMFSPNAEIYDTSENFTKQHLEKEILNVKEQIYRVENDMPIDPNRPDFIVPEEMKNNQIAALEAAIEYYEQLLPDAIDRSELEGASYEMVDKGTDGFQANMEVYADSLRKSVSFVNWDQDRTIGSIFMIEANESVYEGAAIAELVMPESLEDSEEFLGIREKADEYVRGMGIDYMSLNMVTENEESYTLYYTRYYNGLLESYVQRHLGTSALDVDGSGIMMNLWTPEYLEIAMYNGELYGVYWHNPSRVIGIDNENVAIIGWDEGKDIFTDQMDYMLTAELAGGIKEIHINRIELGLVKLLMKDSESDYKLVPSWSFFGYYEDEKTENAENGALVCFMTINALDGSIVDRGWMY